MGFSKNLRPIPLSLFFFFQNPPKKLLVKSLTRFLVCWLITKRSCKLEFIAVPWQVRNSDDAATLILLSLLCCCNYDSDVLSPAHSLILSFSLTCRFFRLLGWSLRISISSIRVAEASELLHGFCFMGLHPALRSPSCWTDSLALPIEYCNNDNQIGIILISTLWQKQLLYM